ncbi:rhamnan synthesis F family protein [Phaeobacter gallaeciensis]|uniref:rhamnan synthesis F family protein n=1 Tax=Phaeobacter gallaeciensis TaxID=60890 RepID=UPI00237F43ED|nr:rhamnan synthesis F family protein [Phaeobacter gallaeciensis]MDE4099384.1 rhamnan synthesis F family protein [Phaeobacter gallaeciensis]MDE4108205.1 rhamnan synthesis F family protein [Phaeobacter gallaeciensis]MDE4112643.1 rhamnan synthesis F family protein [Phaeobacter gallaeciensis]MDE4117112.1 rhamnan synthesis F family protein [Phaeobacter gallaeciensis]MDE4121557.1 rhamnan synthesis F family protein [Phaeobacter gallaeciensis]
MTDLNLIWRKYASKIPDLLKSRPDFRFDPHHYKNQVDASIEDPLELRQHFDAHGSADGHWPTLYKQIASQFHKIDDVLLDLTIDPTLIGAMEAGQSGAHQLAFELLHLGAPVDSIVSDFSGETYLKMNADLLEAGIDPLVHYLCNGAAEGRRILRDIRKGQYSGQLPYRPELPTCLIAVHECSRTGAPIVGRDLAREAAKTHNVIVAALRDGPLLEDFRETSCQVLITSAPFQDFGAYTGQFLDKIDFAIVNSAVAWNYIPLLVARDIPFAGYLHEYAEYLHPAFHFNLFPMFADLLIFSSEHVRNSWRGRMADINFDPVRDSAIIPQRPLFVGTVSAEMQAEAKARLSKLIGRDLSTSRIVCGAGQSQWRKGTDLFAMAAQICRPRDKDTVFIWIGHGIVPDELGFGAYMAYHFRQIDMGSPESNMVFIPAGPAYHDVLTAADVMFMSSRLDPLPNVVFDALEHGCRIVQFDGASGFGDENYRRLDSFVTVEYANPEAAATSILALPPKDTSEAAPEKPEFHLFEAIRTRLEERLKAQRYFVRGASQIDVPVLYTTAKEFDEARVREREKMLRYGRRRIWRDLAEVEQEIAASDNWMHSRMRLAPYATTELETLPRFALHIHAYYTDDLADDLREFAIYKQARRIVVTTDTEAKGCEIRKIMSAEGLTPEIVLVPNTGRDILPFMNLFQSDGVAGQDELWCHLHQKKSIGSTDGGDLWRRFLMRVLLGDAETVSNAVTKLAQDGVGLVTPFDPHFVGWNESRRLLPKFSDRLPGPMPENPLLFPVGNMFWVRRQVVEAMNNMFGPDYPWPDEPIANDGTEYHLIERLWPAMAAQLELDSVFVHKLDEQRI